jgi:hypothetical protein
MKNIFILLILTLAPVNILAKNSSAAITWRPNGGRFGDNLVSYCKAKWFSLQFNIPLLYQPFPYSDQLMIAENEIVYTDECLQNFSQTVELLGNAPYKLLNTSNILYISRWKTELEFSWYDPVFAAELKKNIAPRYEIEKIKIPEDMISIAVHVRNGGTFAADTPEEKERCPLRFVPEEFFIEQIDRIAKMFPHNILYVHIFTDHPNPTKLVKKFQLILNNPRIMFGCREEGNSHKANVLEDFFSMMDFDCLVRPGSHFTRFVERLGKNKLVIYPKSFKYTNQGKKIIDSIIIKQRNSSEEKWKTQLITIA